MFEKEDCLEKLCASGKCLRSILDYMDNYDELGIDMLHSLHGSLQMMIEDCEDLEEFLSRIDEVADGENRSRSELIREALRTYITSGSPIMHAKTVVMTRAIFMAGNVTHP
jgi:hypothetical protein